MGHADAGKSNSDLTDTGGMFQLLARAIDAAGRPVLIIDASERIVWVNLAYRRLSGFPREEIVGAHAAALRSQHASENSYAALRRGDGIEGAAWCREMIGKRRDGSTYIGEEIVTPLRDQSGGADAFCLGTARCHRQQASVARRALAGQPRHSDRLGGPRAYRGVTAQRDC